MLGRGDALPVTIARLRAGRGAIGLIAGELVVLWLVLGHELVLPVSAELAPPTRAAVVVGVALASSMTPLLLPVDGVAERLSCRPIETWTLGYSLVLVFAVSAAAALVAAPGGHGLGGQVAFGVLGLGGVVGLAVGFVGLWATLIPWAALAAMLTMGLRITPGSDAHYASWAWPLVPSPTSEMIAVLLWLAGAAVLAVRARRVPT